MPFLQKFIDRTLSGYLWTMGALTGVLGLLLFVFPTLKILGDNLVSAALYLPATALAEDGTKTLDYSPLIQHWGLLLALVGFFMVAATRNETWVVPAMAISGIEKLFVVVFSVFVYPEGFVTTTGYTVDFLGTVYSLLFFVALRSSREPEPRT